MLTKCMYRVLGATVLCAVVAGAAWAPPVSKASPWQQDDPMLLVYGQTVDAEINGDQPSIFYAFDAQANDVVTITMIVVDGELDPFLVLSDASQTPLATDDNSGGELNARLTFVIPAAGRYLIQATQAGGIPPENGGTFNLNLTAATDGEALETEEAPPVEETAEPSDVPLVQGDSTRLVKIQSGASVRDVLDRQTALRIYWFEGQEGGQLRVVPEQLADFQPLMVLYDADSVELVRSDPGLSLITVLPSDGLYFLGVSLPDARGAGGEYEFTFELGETSAEAGDYLDLTYGQSQQGMIDDSVPAVTYRFRGSEEDVVTITMSRAGGDLNPYLFLLDASGQLLYEDNDSGGENGDARIVYTLPASGEYLIIAARQDQEQGTTSGSYLLDLVSDSPPPTETETPGPAVPVLPEEYTGLPQLAYGDSAEGELTNARFMDIYVFEGTQGDAVVIDLESLNPDDLNALDPYLILLDNERIPLIEHDDIVEGEERDAHIEFTLPRTGYYAIVATRFDQEAGTSTGPYRLTLDVAAVEPAAVTAGAAPIGKLAPAALEAAEPIQDTFDQGLRLYTFTAPAGTLVDLTVTTDPGVDSILILADRNLVEVLSSGTGALTGVTLPTTGQYLVMLAPRFGPVDETGGGYILALTQIGEDVIESGPVETGPLTMAYGDTTNGVIDDEMVSQIITFNGAAGDIVRITMEASVGSSLDCYLELQDGSGAVIDANDDINPGIIRDSQIMTELPADGEYTVIASRYVGEDADVTSGAYVLTLEVITEEDLAASGVSSETVPIAYGDTLVGEINDEQYLLFYVFDGSAGDVITVSIDHLSGSLDTVLYLYQSTDAGWVEIANNDDSPTGGTYEALLSGIVLPQTGKYLIAVGRFGLENENYAGTFAITLTRQP